MIATETALLSTRRRKTASYRFCTSSFVLITNPGIPNAAIQSSLPLRLNKSNATVESLRTHCGDLTRVVLPSCPFLNEQKSRELRPTSAVGSRALAARKLRATPQ